MNQGGPAALLCLELDDPRQFDPARFVATLAERGLDRCFACSVCQQRVGPGSVLITHPGPHPSTGQPICGLAFFCPFCDHVQHWCEASSLTGQPTGVVAMEPRFMTSEESRVFCEKHPEKTSHHPAA
ncbi:MAG: hypothetical protein AAGE65_03560 [Planctomycetota bacterium]